MDRHRTPGPASTGAPRELPHEGQQPALLGRAVAIPSTAGASGARRAAVGGFPAGAPVPHPGSREINVDRALRRERKVYLPRRPGGLVS